MGGADFVGRPFLYYLLGIMLCLSISIDTSQTCLNMPGKVQSKSHVDRGSVLYVANQGDS